MEERKKKAIRKKITADPPPESAAPDQLAFAYTKSPRFESVYADGAFGGITPQGQICFAFYSESRTLPEFEVISLNQEKKLGTRVDSESIVPDTIEREFQTRIHMTLDAADTFQKWLAAKVKLARSLREQGS